MTPVTAVKSGMIFYDLWSYLSGLSSEVCVFPFDPSIQRRHPTPCAASQPNKPSLSEKARCPTSRWAALNVTWGTSTNEREEELDVFHVHTGGVGGFKWHLPSLHRSSDGRSANQRSFRPQLRLQLHHCALLQDVQVDTNQSLLLLLYLMFLGVFFYKKVPATPTDYSLISIILHCDWKCAPIFGWQVTS